MPDNSGNDTRRTAVYWLNHVRPTLTCGVGECTDAERQCGRCREDEAAIRRNAQNEMRDDMLRAMGLGTRHGSVQVRQ